MDAVESLDIEIYRRLHHGLVFRDLGKFQLEGDYYRFNCPECENNQVRDKNTFFARKGLPYGYCKLCGHRRTWWGKLGAGIHGLRKLARLAGLPPENFTLESEPHLTETFRHLELVEDLVQCTISFLLEDPHAETLAYLYTKGFGMEEVKQAEIGCYPSTGEVKEYMLSRGYSIEELNDVGALSPELGTRYKLILPYRRGSGMALGLVAYSTSGGAGRPDKRLFCSEETAVPLHINIALRDREFEETRRLIVVDEPLEAVMLGAMGVGNAVAPVESCLSREGVDFLKNYGVRELVFCLKGISTERVYELAGSLNGLEGINLYTIELKAVEDIIEYMRSAGIETWRRLLMNPTPLPADVPERKAAAEKQKPVPVTVPEAEPPKAASVEEQPRPVIPEKEEKPPPPAQSEEKPPAPVQSEDAAPPPPRRAKTGGVLLEEVIHVDTRHKVVPVEAKIEARIRGPEPFSTREVMDRVAKRQKLTTGFSGLDIFPAVSNDELTVLMGEPGCGKTLLTLNLLLNMMCHHEDLCFLLFSSEAGEQLTLIRLLGILLEMPSDMVEEGLKKGEHNIEVKKGLSQLKGMGLEDRFYLLSRPKMLIEDIFSSARGAAEKGRPIGAIFIDEAHRMREGQDPQETSRKLKAMRMLAENLHAAVIGTLTTDSRKTLGPSDNSALQSYAGTVLSLNTRVEGMLAGLRGIWSGRTDGQKNVIVRVLRPPGDDTAPEVKLVIKPGGKMVEM